MLDETYNEKKIIWASRTKQILVIALSFLFVASAIWTRQKISTTGFWICIILFGGGGLFMLIQFLNPKNRFVLPNSPLGQKIIAERLEKAKTEEGFFIYNETGFGLKTSEGETFCKWVDIKTIFAYKEDRLTVDDVCLDIFTTGEDYIRVTEEIPGWYIFIEQLHKHIPSIMTDWESKVTQPPFATNLTMLFDSRGRTQTEAAAKWYGDQHGS